MYEYNLDKVIIQPYKFVAGEENIVEVRSSFDNSEADNFYCDTENVEFDGSMRIKDSFDLNKTLNADGLYETDAIDVSQLYNLYGIGVK